MIVEMRHVGNGAIFVAPSGKRYEAARNAIIQMLQNDAAALSGHPEWEPVETTVEVDVETEEVSSEVDTDVDS